MVRSAAWTVPVLSVAATAPVFAASPCSDRYSYVLRWGTTAYSRTDARGSSASVTSGDSSAVGVTFASVSSSTANVPDPARNLTVPANTGTPTTADPVVTSLGGRAGERGVMLYHATSTIGRGNRQDVTITFSRPVRGLKFWITDIDTITTPAYSDRVELVGYSSTNGVVPYGFVNDGVTGAGTEASPWLRAGNANVDENASGAQVSVDFTATSPTTSTDVKRLVLTYWNATGGTQYHRIYLGNLSFTAIGC